MHAINTFLQNKLKNKLHFWYYKVKNSQVKKKFITLQKQKSLKKLLKKELVILYT